MKGCDFCCYKENPNNKLIKKENVGYNFYAGVWKRLDLDDIEENEAENINFCPICGRKIKK